MSRTFLLTESNITHLVVEVISNFLNEWSQFQLTGTTVVSPTETVPLEAIENAERSTHLTRDRKDRQHDLLGTGKLGTPLASFFCRDRSGMGLGKEHEFRIHTITSNGVVVVSLDKKHNYKLITLFTLDNPNALIRYMNGFGMDIRKKLQPALRKVERDALMNGGNIGNDYKKFLLPEEPSQTPKPEPKAEPEPEEPIKTDEPSGEEEVIGAKVPRKKRQRISQENGTIFRQRGRLGESLFESIVRNTLNELNEFN